MPASLSPAPPARHAIGDDTHPHRRRPGPARAVSVRLRAPVRARRDRDRRTARVGRAAPHLVPDHHAGRALLRPLHARQAAHRLSRRDVRAPALELPPRLLRRRPLELGGRGGDAGRLHGLGRDLGFPLVPAQPALRVGAASARARSGGTAGPGSGVSRSTTGARWSSRARSRPARGSARGRPRPRPPRWCCSPGSPPSRSPAASPRPPTCAGTQHMRRPGSDERALCLPPSAE